MNDIATNRDRYLTLDEASERFSLGKRTIRRRIADGTLPAYRVGPRALRVRADELEKLATHIPTDGVTERKVETMSKKIGRPQRFTDQEKINIIKAWEKADRDGRQAILTAHGWSSVGSISTLRRGLRKKGLLEPAAAHKRAVKKPTTYEPVFNITAPRGTTLQNGSLEDKTLVELVTLHDQVQKQFAAVRKEIEKRVTT